MTVEMGLLLRIYNTRILFQGNVSENSSSSELVTVAFSSKFDVMSEDLCDLLSAPPLCLVNATRTSKVYDCWSSRARASTYPKVLLDFCASHESLISCLADIINLAQKGPPKEHPSCHDYVAKVKVHSICKDTNLLMLSNRPRQKLN